MNQGRKGNEMNMRLLVLIVLGALIAVTSSTWSAVAIDTAHADNTLGEIAVEISADPLKVEASESYLPSEYAEHQASQTKCLRCCEWGYKWVYDGLVL